MSMSLTLLTLLTLFDCLTLLLVQKLKRRRQAVALSSTWTNRKKEELTQGLFIDTMSTEESEEEPPEPTSSDNDGEDQPAAILRRKIVVRRPSWRSALFNEVLASLDRKSARRQTDKARAMCKDREYADHTIECVVPEGLPAWMYAEPNGRINAQPVVEPNVPQQNTHVAP